MHASARIYLLVYQTDPGHKRSLSWLQRTKIMRRLLKRDFGMDVRFAMPSQFDLNDELDIPADVLKNYQRTARLREWSW